MLKIDNICLNYSYKKVLTGVNAVFEKGKIYALLGENGAGKSTLAHIICGDIQPDSGKMILNGTEVHFSSPHQALAKKIACVHQRPLLAESISIKENLLLGADKITDSMIDRQLKIWLPGIKKNTLVNKLTPSEKFFVSLTGILLKNPEILILDEPTALLNQQQSENLFANIKELTQQGLTVLLITHYLQEALEKAHELLILRNGIAEKAGPVSQFTKETVKEAMFGTNYNLNTETPEPENKEKTETAENEDSITGMNSNLIYKLRKNKTAIIPSDKTFRASNPNLTILQLVTSYKTGLSKKELIAYAENITKKAQVNIRLDEKASCLSGGMLQKLILERELDTNPDTIIFCSPFQGLDTAASQKLRDIIAEQKSKGKNIILTGEMQ